jgi:hypothetical protein
VPLCVCLTLSVLNEPILHSSYNETGGYVSDTYK